MPDDTIYDFAEMASQVIGKLDRLVADAELYPWFCKDISRKRDLQWGGYLGRIGSEEKVLAFGLNLEFTRAWGRVYPKIRGNLQQLSALLNRYPNYEWHWWGRPGMIAKNPPRRNLAPEVWANQVDVTKWVSELEDILERRKMWSVTVPMRPQMQIMRNVGLSDPPTDRVLIRENIQQVVYELEPLVAFLR